MLAEFLKVSHYRFRPLLLCLALGLKFSGNGAPFIGPRLLGIPLLDQAPHLSGHSIHHIAESLSF